MKIWLELDQIYQVKTIETNEPSRPVRGGFNEAYYPHYTHTIEMTKSEYINFLDRYFEFYLDGEAITDGQQSFEVMETIACDWINGVIVDGGGHIVTPVAIFEDEETSEYIVTEPIPDGVVNPRWDGEKWVPGEEAAAEKDAVDALAEEMLDFKIQYNSVPCQYHKEYPALVERMLDDESK